MDVSVGVVLGMLGTGSKNLDLFLICRSLFGDRCIWLLEKNVRIGLQPLRPRVLMAGQGCYLDASFPRRVTEVS